MGLVFLRISLNTVVIQKCPLSVFPIVGRDPLSAKRKEIVVVFQTYPRSGPPGTEEERGPIPQRASVYNLSRVPQNE